MFDIRFDAKKTEVVSLVIFTLLLLFLSKNIYMINQGDFSRLTIGFLDDLNKYDKNTLSFPMLDTFSSLFKYEYISSFSWVVYVYALILSCITNTFDLQIFAALMKSLFIASLYFFYKRTNGHSETNFLVFLISSIPVLSASNFSILQSFYQDQIILPLLPLAVALANNNSNKSLYLTFICVTLIATTKSQYFYTPVLFMVFFVLFNRERLKLKLALSFISLILAISAILLSSGASQFNKYHSIYFGSLIYLKDNHYKIPDKYDVNCIGSDAWGNILDKNEGAVRSDIGMTCMNKNASLGFKDSVGDLLKHPAFIFKLPFESTMQEFYGEDYFHVYKSYKLIHCDSSILCELPKIKDKLFNTLRFPVLAILMLGSMFLIKQRLSGSIFIISSFGISQLYISFLGEGYRDINKHLVGMNYAFDLILFMLSIWVLTLVITTIRTKMALCIKR